ncbi:MAG: hypothetical protein HY718_02740 [Planctomycetes bacterium]|nr:hypothetical protein [Planctomycetota bacterium]
MRSALVAVALAGAFLSPAPGEEPTKPRLRVYQRVGKPDAEAAVDEVRQAGLSPDAVVLPTETEFNDPRQVETVAAAAEALLRAGTRELWLEIGLSGQTLDPEHALVAAQAYVKAIPRAKGLVIHWLFPKRFLPPPKLADPYLRRFAAIGLPLIVMGDPEPRRTLEYTGLEWEKVEAIAQVVAAAPDLYFAHSMFEFDEHDVTIVGRWLDTLARTSRLPLYPCIRVRTAIDAKGVTLADFEAMLEMVAKRDVPAIILEGGPKQQPDWARWRESMRRILGR